jgi:hypothetical protein
MPETQQLDARLRASSAQATQTRPAAGAVLLAARNAKRGLCSLTSSEKERQQQTHRFYSLQVNILGVSGSAHGTQDDVDAESSVICCIMPALGAFPTLLLISDPCIIFIFSICCVDGCNEVVTVKFLDLRFLKTNCLYLTHFVITFIFKQAQPHDLLVCTYFDTLA